MIARWIYRTFFKEALDRFAILLFIDREHRNGHAMSDEATARYWWEKRERREYD